MVVVQPTTDNGLKIKAQLAKLKKPGHNKKAMKMHPVDIAKEFRGFNFFKSFSDELLLQLCTMTEIKVFKKDDLILTEGQTNTSLYFLRKGNAEIMLAGEVVAILQTPGDVMGDMSVATGKPVSTTIRAATETQLFVIDSKDFDRINGPERDHFAALLYRLYSIVLAERLVKTNEKARLFEIANRELHQAQVTLDKLGDKSVLLIEPDRKQLVMTKMAVAATGVKMDVAPDGPTGEVFLAANKYDAVICDETQLPMLKKLKDEKYKGKLVLMISKESQKSVALLKNLVEIDNVITRDPNDRSFTMRIILTTLTKVLTGDIFGLDKYLSWGVDIQSEVVKGSDQRDSLRERMTTYLKQLGVRNTVLDRTDGVAEEMLMNAIYDAPTDPQGNSLFNHLSRQVVVKLDTHLQGKLHYSCDGIMVAISVTDPFGALSKDIIIDYLESCYQDRAGSLNEAAGKGGAGRGLHQIIENADLTIFNVKKKSRTEVICLFSLEGPKGDTPSSFHYFFSE